MKIFHSVYFIPFFLLILSLVSCMNIPSQENIANSDTLATQGVLSEYEIGPEDVLEVLVWRNESLSKVVIVRPDGKISLPLIGDIQASGHTVDQVRASIVDKLKTYYNESPQVSLIVKEVNSYVIYIMGEVQKPAQYMVKRGTTFLQAVALAGGFTPFASTNDVIVLRKTHDNNDQLALNIRYKDIFSGKYRENNILLKAGDTIIVP